MAKYFSGKDGKLYVGGTNVAQLQNWSFSQSMSVLEITAMGDTDRTLKPGVRSYSGSARLFYETTSGGSNLKDILENSIKVSETSSAGGDGENAASGELKLKLEVGTNRSITFFVFITSIGMNSSMGEVSSCDISFEANGAPVENKLPTGS